jgi:uncharacterized membrane protein
MSIKRIYIFVLGLVLSLGIISSAVALMNSGGSTGGGSTSCARCTSAKQCAGGYTSGGSDCVNQCTWNGKEWTNCTCWTLGDCPKTSFGGGTVFLP